MTPPTAPDPLLTLPQVADALQVVRRTVDRLIADGELKRIKIRRSVRVQSTELAAYIQRQKDKRS